jgi:AraC-like DNA-binding protein
MKKYWQDAGLGIKSEVAFNYTPSLIAKSAFFYLQSIGHFCCDEGYFTRREGYKSFLLIYTISGKGYAKYRNKQYELTSGQVLIMDCYDFQEYYSDKDELWEIKWIHFNGSTSYEYFNTIYEKFGPVINIYDKPSIPAYLDEITILAKEGDLQLEVKASRLIMGMLTELLLADSQKNDEYKVRMLNEHVQSAMDYVDSNFEHDISLVDMAASACCSVYHFTRVFKRATGYSPHEYLIKYRVNKAKSQLKNTTKSIDDIAGCVGFCSTSNFIRTFRELEDMTPLKYRKYWTG